MNPVLDRRALNRATLARQLLLARSPMPALDAVHHLVGMQAQVPLNPYTGLWSRLDGFQPEELAGLLLDRKVVRIVVMRATIHLVTAEDCLLLRPLMQPILVKELAHHRDYAPALVGIDLEPVLAFAGAAFAESPRTGPQLRMVLGERFPDLDAGALLSHDDRSRFTSVPFAAPAPVHGTVLVDGFVRATWALDGSTLTIHHAGLDRSESEELESEGARFLRFLGLPAGDVRLSG